MGASPHKHYCYGNSGAKYGSAAGKGPAHKRRLHRYGRLRILEEPRQEYSAAKPAHTLANANTTLKGIHAKTPFTVKQRPPWQR